MLETHHHSSTETFHIIGQACEAIQPLVIDSRLIAQCVSCLEHTNEKIKSYRYGNGRSLRELVELVRGAMDVVVKEYRAVGDTELVAGVQDKTLSTLRNTECIVLANEARVLEASSRVEEVMAEAVMSSFTGI